MANSGPETSATMASAARAPPSFWARDDALGRRVRLGRAVGDLRGERARRVVELVARVDAVDDVPALQRRGVEQLAGEDQLLGAGGAGALGQPLRAAHRRRQADDDLDEPELRALAAPAGRRRPARSRRPPSGRARARRRPSGTAARRARGSIASSSSHSSPPRSGVMPSKTLPTSTPPLDDLALGADQQAARRVGRDRVDRVAKARRRPRRRRGSAAGRRRSGPRAARPARGGRRRSRVVLLQLARRWRGSCPCRRARGPTAAARGRPRSGG